MRYQIWAIHGTYVNSEKLRGTQWWQRDSAFHKGLFAFLDLESTRVEWVPKRWSGENSERERKNFAKVIEQEIRNDTVPEDRVVVLLGHSHGGNIADMALRNIPRDGRTTTGAVIVGTPIVQPQSRLGNLAAIAAFILAPAVLYTLLSVAISVYALSEVIPQIMRQSSLLLAGVYASAALSLVIVYALFSAPVTRMIDDIRKRNAKSLDTYRELYERMIRVYSLKDEAINGLKSLRHKLYPIASPQTTFHPTAWLMSILAMVGLFAYLTLNEEVRRVTQNLTNSWAPDAHNSIQVVLFVSAPIALSILTGYFVSRFGGAALVSYAVNAIVTANFVSKAYGADIRPFLTQITVDSNRLDLPESFWWKPLPLQADKDLERLVEGEAPATLRAAREELAVNAMNGTRNIFESMSATLSWRELIHTSYLECPSMVEFIAYILIEQYHFPPSPKYLNVDKEKYREWLNQIRPPGSSGAQVDAEGH